MIRAYGLPFIAVFSVVVKDGSCLKATGEVGYRYAISAYETGWHVADQALALQWFI